MNFLLLIFWIKFILSNFLSINCCTVEPPETKYTISMANSSSVAYISSTLSTVPTKTTVGTSKELPKTTTSIKREEVKFQYVHKFMENYVIFYTDVLDDKIRSRISAYLSSNIISLTVYDLNSSNMNSIQAELVAEDTPHNITGFGFEYLYISRDSEYWCIDFNFVICDSNKQKINFGNSLYFYPYASNATHSQGFNTTVTRLENMIRNADC